MRVQSNLSSFPKTGEFYEKKIFYGIHDGSSDQSGRV